MIINLPIEIVELIFDYVRDKKSQRAIALTCKEFFFKTAVRSLNKHGVKSVDNTVSVLSMRCAMNQKCIICDKRYIGGFIKPFGLYAHRKCVRNQCVNEYFYKKDGHNVWVMKQSLPYMKCAMKMKHWWGLRHPNQPRSTIHTYSAFWDKKDPRLVNDEWTFEYLWDTDAQFRENTERNLMRLEEIEAKKIRDKEKRKRKFDEKWEIREQKRQRLHNYLIDEFGADDDLREEIIKAMIYELPGKTDFFKFNKKRPRDTVEDVIRKAREDAEVFCKGRHSHYDIIDRLTSNRIDLGDKYDVCRTVGPNQLPSFWIDGDYMYQADDHAESMIAEGMSRYEQELFKKYKPLEYLFRN